MSSPSRSPSWRGAPPGKSSNAPRAAIPGGRGQRGWRTRPRGGVRSGVILVHPLPVRCPPCGRRRAPRSPTLAPITGERDRFRPLAPPVAVWAAFWGRVADVAAAAGSRAVGRRWAWRCAGLVRQACRLPCVQPRLARRPARRALYAVVRRTRRRGGVVRGTAVPAGWGRLPRGVACACCAREATSWSPASSSSCSLMML